MEYFKLKFNTSDVSALDKSNTSSLWLLLMFSNANTIDDIFSLIMTQQQLRTLKANPTRYIKLTKKAASYLNKLSFEIQEALGKWCELITNVDSISEPVGFKSSINRYAPDGSKVDDLLETWRPGERYFNEYKAHAMTDIKQVDSELMALKTQLRRIAHNSLKNLCNKMTLTDKLTVLNGMVKN